MVVALVGFGERGGGLVMAGEKHRGNRGARWGWGCFVIYHLVFLFYLFLSFFESSAAFYFLYTSRGERE